VVDSQLEGVSAISIVTLDVVVVSFEDGKSVVVFLFCAIGSVVLRDEVDEFSLGVADWGRGKEVCA